MKKSLFVILCLAALLLFAACAPKTPFVPAAGEPENAAPVQVETGIKSIKKYGNIILSIAPASMRELGFEPGDIILARIGNVDLEMPIGTAYSDVDAGEMICCYKTSSSSGNEEVVLALNGGDLTTSAGIAKLKETEGDPGYEWIFPEGSGLSSKVAIFMREKQGYASGYAVHQLGATRTNDRKDYAKLTDAEFANYREVTTAGMGKGTLFRSSSPVNPVLGRSSEADRAMLGSLVKTVMNMADSEAAVKGFPDYAGTYYAGCDVIALEMPMDFFSDEFAGKFAEGLRFFLSHDGPYLIHCREGKDRTGFACAVLECFMGASADEAVADYMLTYYNFYGIGTDSEQYGNIAAGNIESSLAKAFGVDSIRAEGTDLKKCAENYLRGIGLTKEEIASLRTNLQKDYGGLIG